MKYIKLYEAFESNKLSKTIGFINKGAKGDFLYDLRTIGRNFDFPISEFSDDMFEYLPFKSALKKNVKVEDREKEPCNHESDWIPGEFCQGGQVKRTWGSKTRTVKCGYCDGTGFKKVEHKDPEIQLIKFWFDKDGNYVTRTACDGLIRKQKNTIKSSSIVDNEVELKKLREFSRDINDYIKDISLDHNDIKRLETGDIIYFKPSWNKDMIIGMVLKIAERGSEKTYILQDEMDGLSPDSVDIEEWDDFSNYTWEINNSYDLSGDAILLIPKDVKLRKEKKKVDNDIAYSWNNTFSIGYMTMDNRNDIMSVLKNAHFAIILDLNKLRKKEYKKVQDIRTERALVKAGAFIKPEEVKSANLNRYLDLMIAKFDANKGLSEITKIAPRILGYNNCITFILYPAMISEFETIIEYTVAFMRNPTEYNEKDLVSKVKTYSKKSNDLNTKLNVAIDRTWKKIDEYDNKVKMGELFELYLSLGKDLKEKIMKYEIQSISDMDMLALKIRNLRTFVKNSKFESIRDIYYISDYLIDDYNVARHLNYMVGSFPDCLKEISQMKRIIQNF